MMEHFSTFFMVAALVALGLVGLVLAAVWVSDLVLAKWRAAKPASRAAFVVGAALAALYGGSKTGTVSYPKTEAGRAYLTDNGSYVTNDWVHIDFKRQVVPDEAWFYVDRCLGSITNADEAAASWETVYSNTFSQAEIPFDLPCESATNWNWIVYADWTPAPTVHTNGVLEVKWGVSRNDAAHRAAGLAVGIPVQTKIEFDNGLTPVTPDERKAVVVWTGDGAAAGLTNGAAVEAWRDVAGVRTATALPEPVVGGRVYPLPTVALGAFNGHAAVSFGDSALAVPPAGNPLGGCTSWTVCAVLSTTGGSYASGSWYACGGVFGLEEGGTQNDWALVCAGGRFGIGMGVRGIGDYTHLSPSGVSYADGRPHVVFASLDGDGAQACPLTLCVDGERWQTSVSALGRPRNKSQLRFGGRSTERLFYGLLAEARFYVGKALTADEMDEVGERLAAKYGATWTRPASE